MEPWEQEILNNWIFTLYNIASLIFIFFVFGFTVRLITIANFDKDFKWKRKLRKALKHIPQLEKGRAFK